MQAALASAATDRDAATAELRKRSSYTARTSGTTARALKNCARLAAVLFDISQLLQTGLDRKSLETLVGLTECGVNPEALASVVKELRRESAALRAARPDSSRRALCILGNKTWYIDGASSRRRRVSFEGIQAVSVRRRLSEGLPRLPRAGGEITRR